MLFLCPIVRPLYKLLTEMQPIADIRKDYKLKTLTEQEVSPDAIAQFTTWWNEALQSEIDEVNAMTLATADAHGVPDARIVLLKEYDERGFVFFTNYDSVKGRQLLDNPRACLVFFWKELERQVRIRGTVEQIADSESDVYFQSRPEGSRIGAWASPQSSVIASRDILETNVAEYTDKFAAGSIPRPAHWGGYRISPQVIEFWQGRSSRLHDRICYTATNDNWQITRLAP
jgi:pyridoxamine 5'-phosphate oxidase